MNSLCACKKLTHVKMAADMAADPFWCTTCGYNLDIDEMKISEPLKEQLISWAGNYGSWINWDSDTLKAGGERAEKEHNEVGRILIEAVSDEVEGEYEVVFSPSLIAQSYRG